MINLNHHIYRCGPNESYDLSDEDLKDTEKLAQSHESKPWNPIIAGVFYRAGIIERWGTGTLNILDWCAENGNPAPAWAEQAGSVVLTFVPQTTEQVEDQVKAQVAGEVTGEVQRLLEALVNLPMTRLEAQKSLGLKGQANFRDRYLQPALSTKLIEMTIPDKPRSSKQRYRLTEKGREWLDSYRKGIR